MKTYIRKTSYFILILTVLFSCKKQVKKNPIATLFTTKVSNVDLLNKKGNTITTRFNPIDGYTRIATQKETFQNYLQNFPLKPHNTKVYQYDGEEKYRQDVHAAVFDIDAGKRDLQQCADATMRLRAEFLYEQKRFSEINFNFTNGFKANYSKWRKGYRISVKGNNVSWFKTDRESKSYKAFRKYLVMVFSYAGTLSLEKELDSVGIENLQIGDIFIQGGSPGHAIIVVDMAKNKTGEKIFMLAQSYMPAQDIHILKNHNNTEISPWYKAVNFEELVTPEWTFKKENIKRF